MKFIKWKGIILSFKIFIYKKWKRNHNNNTTCSFYVYLRWGDFASSCFIYIYTNKQFPFLLFCSVPFCFVRRDPSSSMSVLFSLELYFILQAFHFNGLDLYSILLISQGQLVSSPFPLILLIYIFSSSSFIFLSW